MKLTNRLFIAVALCSVGFVGCSTSPSPGAAEEALRQKIESESGGKIKLVSFKKTDGQKIEGAGVEAYRMDYEAEIEFAASGTWSSGAIRISFGFSETQAKQGSWANFASQLDGGKSVHRGDHVKLTGVMNCQKKESGWKFEVGESQIVSRTAGSIVTASGGQQGAAAQTQIESFKTALDAYKVDNGYYPKSENGLVDLVQKPRDAQHWFGPYLNGIPKDPWGHNYIYECPGRHNPSSYDLSSLGPPGTNTVIGNWAISRE